MNIVITTRQQHPVREEVLHALVQESYRQWIDAGIQASWLNRSFDEFRVLLRNAVVFLAINTDDNKVIGMHCYYCFPEKHYARGFYLCINPEMKHQGIATRMLQYEKEQMLARGYEYLRCVTEVPASWSISWHLKNGYHIVGYRKSMMPYNDIYSFRLQLALFSWQRPSTWLWNNPLAPVTARCCYAVSYTLVSITHHRNGELNWIGRTGKSLRRKMTAFII